MMQTLVHGRVGGLNNGMWRLDALSVEPFVRVSCRVSARVVELPAHRIEAISVEVIGRRNYEVITTQEEAETMIWMLHLEETAQLLTALKVEPFVRGSYRVSAPVEELSVHRIGAVAVAVIGRKNFELAIPQGEIDLSLMSWTTTWMLTWTTTGMFHLKDLVQLLKMLERVDSRWTTLP